MRDIFTLCLHAIVIIIRLARPGGLRSVVAESVLMRHQVLILNRGRKRAPNLRASDRIIAGLCTALMRPARVLRSAIALKAIDIDAFSQDADEAKVPPPVFTQTGPTAGSQRTHERTHRRRCGNEAAQSHLGLQANCTAYRSGLRHRDRQRRRSANSGNPFPAGSELRRSVMAVLYRSRQRLAVVIGSVSM